MATSQEMIDALKLTEKAREIAQMLGQDPGALTVEQGILTLKADAYAQSLLSAGLNIDDALRYHQHKVDYLAGTAAAATVVAIEHMANNPEISDVLLTADLLPGVESADITWQREHKGYNRSTREHETTYGHMVMSITNKDSLSGPGPFAQIADFSRRLGQERLKEIAQAL